MSIRGKKSMAAPLKSVDFSSISKATPYIQRIVQDAKLRENVRTAYDSSRSAYERLTNGKAPAKALIEDKKLQRDLQQAVEALRDATTALTEGPQKQRPRRIFAKPRGKECRGLQLRSDELADLVGIDQQMEGRDAAG